ncbi:MAG TPA: amidohydrolase family protein, partial [Chloroflexota bacterium]|nr:amidohydrolase family protein [Chloroflexota bacterium]
AHVHLTLRRGETSVEHVQRVSEHQALLRGVQVARQILAAGVTTVRDCASRGLTGQSLRDGVRDGFIAGPRILVSGPPVTTTSGHLWALGYESDTVEQARSAVRRLVKEGVDLIKVCATGGGMTPGSVVGRAQYTAEELRAIVEDAHRLERPVAAHVHGTEGIARAVEAGVDTLEHVSWLDSSGHGHAFDERVARQMAEKGIFANIASSPLRSLVERGRAAEGAAPSALSAPSARSAPSAPPIPPTVGDARTRTPSSAAGQPDTAGVRASLARWEFARRMIELGVPVCFSTDAVYGYWDDGHDLSYLAQALVEVGGFVPLDVIRMITAIPAQAIGSGDRLGTIAEGNLADLLLVAADPIENIRALHDVRAVYKEGILAA